MNPQFVVYLKLLISKPKVLFKFNLDSKIPYSQTATHFFPLLKVLLKM